MRNCFVWNDISSEYYGVWVENPVEIPMTQRRAEKQTVVGSAKVLHVLEGDAVEPVTATLDCVLRDGYDFGELNAWLQGAGVLRLPGDELHCRRAYLSKAIDLAKVIRARGDRRFTLTFDCEGWRYHWPIDNTIDVESGHRVINQGSALSEPLIYLTMDGSGDGELDVGDCVVRLDSYAGTVALDCDAHMAYDADSGDLLSGIVRREGDWPTIPIGTTVIRYSGGITGLKLTPRWRDW